MHSSWQTRRLNSLNTNATAPWRHQTLYHAKPFGSGTSLYVGT